jgi:ParB/RepB/Spo0J family partition protein
MKVLVQNILPNPDQPRTIFDQAELEGLAQSIKENDLIQPIVVEQVGLPPHDQYILVDGERRWRAHQLAGLKEIEVVVRPSTNHNGLERLTRALVANVQRSNMGFVDEAKAYQRLIDELGSVEAVSQKTGVHIHTINARLMLLELSEATQKLYNLRRLPFDLTVIALLKRLTKDQQDRLVSTAVTRGWKTTSILRAGQNMISQSGKLYTPRKRERVIEEKIGGGAHFDALAMVDCKLPSEIRIAARATCRACSLYPEAGLAICKQCPLPDFLRRMGAKA